MPEVYTCECGNQTWTLYSSDDIVCALCETRYRLRLYAGEFNVRREDYDNTPQGTQGMTNAAGA